MWFDDSMTFKQFLNVTEVRTKVVSVSSFALGTLYAAYRGQDFSWLTFALMFPAVLLVDMGTTAFNSYFDFRRGVDSKKRNRETDKELVHGGLSSTAALLTALSLFAAAVPLGLALGILRGPWIILVGVAGMLMGFLYNGGPRPLSHGPFGELFAGGFLGGVLFVLSYAVQRQQAPVEAILVALPSLLLVSSILTVNNTCDLQGDREAGRRTLSIVLGRRAARLLIAALGTAAFVLALVLTAVGWLPWSVAPLLLAAAIPAAGTYRRMLGRGFSHETKSASMRGIVKVLALYTLAVAAGLAVAVFAA